ncbi:hypothetical protein [Actinoallomurus rhizosphaericola]|uniref:hypothetical protein n=1 Tax=Actinoallomurus rhizosphaericola TaxID=2952536 RepID=UPI002092719A|nr:hypothetical protein [Actinoallomurus rhizosphaericola]MCO5995011.1 hypothetical protein [Actinoallomurus rhizosphaericola]
MRIPFRATLGVPMAAVVAAGVLALSAGPASASSHGKEVAQTFGGSLHGCVVSLYYNKHTGWAYADTGVWAGGPWQCKGFVKNNHGGKSWTAKTATDAWSGGVWRPRGYKAQACSYAYYKGKYQGWRCTKWY